MQTIELVGRDNKLQIHYLQEHKKKNKKINVIKNK